MAPVSHAAPDQSAAGQAFYAHAGAASPHALADAGTAAAAVGDPWSAAGHFRAQVDADPDDAVAHKNLAAMLLEQGPAQAGAVRTHSEAAVRLAPTWADAHWGLGVVLQQQGDHHGAMARYQQALALDPEHAAAHASYLTLTQAICDWAHLGALWARSRHWLGGPDLDPPRVLTPLSVVAMPSSAAEQHEAARRWVAAYVPGRSPPPRRPTTRRRPAGPLRVGYLSADWREHPVARQLVGTLEQHDRTRVHVTAYSLGPDDDSALCTRLRDAARDWVDLAALPAQEAARRIADDGTDVLIDLQGYTQGCRPEILAQRPAPVQVSFLGYPGTLAAPFMDYVVTDHYLTPPDQQQHWSERFAYLPDCYMPPNGGDRRQATGDRDDVGPTRQDCGLPARGVVFCCFNHTAKITPACFDVWCRLLQRTPDSVLWLFAAHPCAPTQVRTEAEARGVDAGRLVFTEHRSHADYCALYALADLFLDTWPYNGGATAHDALAAGLPVLTLSGATYVSRMAGSQLRAVGLSDLIASTPEEYERTALCLARAPSWLALLHARLAANRQTWPLFDLARYTRHLEDTYAHIHMAACSSAG